MYILPTQEAMQEIVFRFDGPFVMLNLYRLREVADYSANPEFAPETPISGRELFDQYASVMDEHLAEVGAERVFLANGGSCLIGPSDERWDIIQFVRYPSVESFLRLGTSEAMLADMPHRFAMLEDSRVIPMQEIPLTVTE
ncbi:MAG: hypothetical protein WAM60_14845 [Candidatus Promineifilaceae bacterium]